jgi:hypothetical protein
MMGNMQCFSYLQTVEKSFFEEKNVEKCHFSYPPVEITPKILANFASLNSSIAFGDLRLGGCLRVSDPQAPARAQSPTRNTRIKRRKIRKDFWGHFGIRESEVYTYIRIPQNLRFELKIQKYKIR